MSLEEAKKKGWEELDVIIVTGDAYVDHPGFGTSIIGRVLEDAGYRVGVIAQPKWDDVEDFKKLGKPRLFFAISAGNTDSMVSNYTPSKRLRHDDAYSPGNKPGLRPNSATLVYSNRLREAYPEVPRIIGGIEASLSALLNTTIGLIKYANQFLQTHLQTFLFTAWENSRYWR